MRVLRHVNFWARIATAVPILVGALFYMAAAFALTRNVRHARRTYARVLAFTARLARLEVATNGLSNLDGMHPCVIVTNQQSLLCYSVIAKLHLAADNWVLVARLTEEWDLPIVRALYRGTGNISVDPKNPVRSGLGVRAALKALRSGATVFIFPEGTRWKVPGQLGPFKRGAFLLAIEAGVPLVPVVISPLRPASDLAARRLERNRVEVRVLEPIMTDGMTRNDIGRLRQMTSERMRAVTAEMFSGGSQDERPESAT